MRLPRLMVAPNGARLQKSDHPAIPITLPEMLACAADCAKAGADGLHLHIRDQRGHHLLDAGVYREAVAALAQQCPDLTVQITTEAVGIYSPAEQRAVALESGCAHVSVSVREISRDGPAFATQFFADCAARGIHAQHILYDLADAELLAGLVPAAQLSSPELQVLFVLGRYSATRNSDPAELDPFIGWMDALGIRPDWAVCAFGAGETACLLRSAKLGGKCRLGFENSTLMADGSIAPSNAARVAEMVALLAKA